MKRRHLKEILIEVRDLLKREKELSVRQIARKIGSQWRTTHDALELLKKLGIVEERKAKDQQNSRLFRLRP